MVDAGGFGPDDRVELLDGEIWDMSPQGTRHAVVYTAVHMALQRAFGEGHHMRCQLPFALDETSEPEPDVAVVRGAPFDYLESHPSEAQLIVEVSDSSLRHDRSRKLAAYARNGIPEYWILDLQASRLEVYREPAGTAYASKTVLAAGDTVTPLHAPEATIAVSDLLP